MPVYLPGFASATLARGAHESLTNSLFRSAYELLFTPLPEAEKRRAKALIDVGIDKLGSLAGSAVVARSPRLEPGNREVYRPLYDRYRGLWPSMSGQVEKDAH